MDIEGTGYTHQTLAERLGEMGVIIYVKLLMVLHIGRNCVIHPFRRYTE